MAGSKIPLEDAQAFSQLFEETYINIFRFVYGIYGGPREEVEDITAETYARAWKARKRFSGDKEAATGWLIRIARNLIIDRFRREKVRKQVALDGVQLREELTDEHAIEPERHLDSLQQISTLWVVLQGLPVEQREILVLRYFLGWQVNRIAEHTGMMENTVSQQIRRSIQKIREAWPE